MGTMQLAGVNVEESYRLLFEGCLHPMWVRDKSTHRVLAVNEAALRQYGYSREEFLQSLQGDLACPADIDGSHACFEDDLLPPITHRRRDGSTVLAEVYCRDIVFNDSQGELVTAIDVSSRQRHVESLVRKNEALRVALQSSVDEFEGFCFSVSHDLRGPLRAVDGFSQAVLTDPDATLSDDSKDALFRVRRAASRMGELIDGLLNLSRISRLPMEPKWIDLSALVQRACHDLRANNPERQIQFDIAPGQKAFGDPRLVATLVESLLSNAFKFTGRRADAVVQFNAEDGGWSIADNGIGFDMAYTSQLFKPFEKLHGMNEFPGNGLGLALAYRIVRRHGGTIQGTGDPGGGASFYFSLPSSKLT